MSVHVTSGGLSSSRLLTLPGKLTLAIGSMLLVAIVLAIVSQAVVGHLQLERVAAATAVCLVGVCLAIVCEQFLLQPGMEMSAMMVGMALRTALPLGFLLLLFSAQGVEAARSAAWFVLPLYFVGLVMGTALSVAHCRLHSSDWLRHRHLAQRGTAPAGHDSHAESQSYRS